MAASVCDGATESVLAKDWARLLATAAAARALSDPGFFETGSAFEEFAAHVVSSWDPWLDEYAHHREAEGRPLRWYEQEKLRGSTFATMLSVLVTPDDGIGWRWQAAALGDSCVFHVRGDQTLTAFPVLSADEFGMNPNLFGSRNRDTALLAERTRFIEGVCVPGDRLLLMSDALAAWFMAAPDQAVALGELLEFGGPHDAVGFADWLDKLRLEHELRNDDVALIRIDFEGR
ncbi:hypothetical protein JK358_32120 [Nocardia sp. 2]|uniref:Protein phosphatase 2C domain-containing protein n=1 Tax=Nocardia acididurans TaxID=2802282 RepID=A0ABS1MG72_9NOCA|nr:hypothetical protein [Nocardia acididurans]MBL1079060.1 hypothetical protein [Nocardia acididurans]